MGNFPWLIMLNNQMASMVYPSVNRKTCTEQHMALRATRVATVPRLRPGPERSRRGFLNELGGA